jgi:hypothetical protein
MRTRASVVMIGVALAAASAAYAGGGPGDVYTDFAQDGKLSCDHPRSDLEAALRSGTLNQYGDPLTLARMKLAVRKQLAGGCRRGSSSRSVGTGTTTGTPTQTTGGGGAGEKQKSNPKKGPTPGEPPKPKPVERSGTVSQDNGSFLVGRGLIIGLLAAAVALGGWLTKHALSARR